MTKAFIGFIVAIAVLWASNAIAQTAEPQPAAKIVVDAPLAEPLSRGVAFIRVPHRKSADRPGVRPEGARCVAPHRASPCGG